MNSQMFGPSPSLMAHPIANGAPEAEGPLSKRGQSVAIVKLKGSQNEDISP